MPGKKDRPQSKSPTQPRKRRKRGPKKGSKQTGRKGIDRAVYEQMVAAWRERPSVSYVARRCGVSRPTARKYLENGDPERDMPAIKGRNAAIVHAAQHTVDEERLAADVEMVVLVREAKRHALEELRRRQEDPGRWGKEQMGSLLGSIHKIEQDLTGDLAQYADPLAELDDEEVVELWHIGLDAATRYGFGRPANNDWVPPGGPVEDETQASGGAVA